MKNRSRAILFAGAALLVAVIPLRAQQSRTLQSSQKATLANDPNSIPQQVTFGQLIAAINSQPNHLARLKGITDLQSNSVRLVNIQGLMVGNNPQALETALERNQHAVADMRAAVDANAVIASQLRARELKPDNVVAVDVAANGTVWVFYRQ